MKEKSMISRSIEIWNDSLQSMSFILEHDFGTFKNVLRINHINHIYIYIKVIFEIDYNICPDDNK